MLDRSPASGFAFLGHNFLNLDLIAVSECHPSRWQTAVAEPFILSGFVTRLPGGGCDLLGPVGIAAQLGITFVCGLAFLGSWYFDTVRRDFWTWACDVSKQVAGAVWGKCCNITQAILFATVFRLCPEQEDECVWYLMTIATDCLFLTFLLWGANSLMRPILLDHYGIDIGDYGSEPKSMRDALSDKASGAPEPVDDEELSVQSILAAEPWSSEMWLTQLFVWLAIITVVRFFVGVLLYFSQCQLYVFYAQVFVWFGMDTPTERILFAVLIFPAFADIFAILMQDYFLKKKQ